MHVFCKGCGAQIAVADRPSASTSLRNVQVKGNVTVAGGGISFGPGGGISFGAGGGIGFGPPQKSKFACPSCGVTNEYEPGEIKD
jgi:hypothetical protein